MKTKDGKEVKVGDVVWDNRAEPVKIISQPNINSHFFKGDADKNFIWLGDPTTGRYVYVGDVSRFYGEEKNALIVARDYYQAKVTVFETEATVWKTRMNEANSRLNKIK